MPGPESGIQPSSLLSRRERCKRFLPTLTHAMVIVMAVTGTNTNMFYSYDYGNVHFISLSTESDYPDSPIDPSPYSGWRVQDEYFQVNWLLQDLEMAQKNRKNVPWIIVGAHRPVYAISECATNPIAVHTSILSFANKSCSYCSTDGEQHNGVPKRQAAKVQAWLEPLFQQYQGMIHR